MQNQQNFARGKRSLRAQTANFSASGLSSLIFLEARKGVRADFSVRP
jgi:hypothetical protein